MTTHKKATIVLPIHNDLSSPHTCPTPPKTATPKTESSPVNSTTSTILQQNPRTHTRGDRVPPRRVSNSCARFYITKCVCTARDFAVRTGLADSTTTTTTVAAAATQAPLSLTTATRVLHASTGERLERRPRRRLRASRECSARWQQVMSEERRGN